MTVFNGQGFAREEIIDLPAAFANGAKTAEGKTVPVCAGKARITLPAFGAVTLPRMPSCTSSRLMFRRIA